MDTTENYNGIQDQFDLKKTNTATEEEMIQVLAKRISEMLDHETDLLFSTLYRLDIYESKINAILNSNEDTSTGLARLVIERQKQKLKSRADYKEKSGGDSFIDID
jgi:ribosomal protein S15P/S13E